MEGHPAFKMFGHLSNRQLIELMDNILYHKIKDAKPNDALLLELFDHDPGKSKSSQYRHLNKLDILKIIYVVILPEILRIDSTPLDQLPLLINETWTCKELENRLKWRLINGI